MPPCHPREHDASGVFLRKRSVKYRRVLPSILVIGVASVICQPAAAHEAAGMGVAADQFAQGIPVYWPYHAALMTAGLVLLVSGFVVMRYHKTRNWYRSHEFLQTAGGLSAVAGLVLAVTMVKISGIGHFGTVHGIVGSVTIALLVATLFIGFYIFRNRGVKPPIRKVHRWLGGISIGMVAVNIVLGISMMLPH